MKTKNFLTIFLIALFVASSSVFTSCKKDKGDPPAIPASSTFVMDFSDFKENKSVMDTTSQAFGHSVANVVIWNAVITLGLAVPVAAFIESFNHQAEFENDWWVWSYSVNVGVDTYNASLHGKVDGQTVKWEMYISKVGGFTDFKWFTGTSDVNGAYGQWILYNSHINQTTLLQIDWNRNANGTADIKYMNIVPNGPENGGYIMYGKTLDTDYDRFYDIYNKGQDNLTSIKWNFTNKNGRVKDFKKFNDNNFHCWDTAGKDVVCQ